MSNLSLLEQSKIIAALCEGVSIRSTERLTGHHRDTIMRLMVQVGDGCNALHSKLMKNLTVAHIELDEMWSFVGKKRRQVQETDPDTIGEQYVYFAMDSTGKAILSWRIGKRTARNTIKLVEDVRTRVLGNPEFSTDGLPSYPGAIDLVFDESAHGVVDKQTVMIATGPDSKKNYVRETLKEVKRIAVKGAPTLINTSYIERMNLTVRMSQRRFTRDTNAFSKKFENHCAAVALHVAHYNLCRIHETLRITPAMHLGVTDRVWTVSELVAEATGQDMQARVARAKGFKVIQGGKTA